MECKPEILKCVIWLLNTQTNEVDFIFDQERQMALETLIGFVKKLYCVQRIFSDTNELYDAVRSMVRSYGLCENQ